MRITVLSPYLPHRQVGHGGGTAVRDLVASLARRHEVQLVSLLRPGEESRTDDVAALGVTVVGIPFLDQQAQGGRRLELFARRLRAAARAAATGYPFYVAKYGSPYLARAAIAAVESFAPHAVQVEYLQLSLVLRELRRWRDRRAPGEVRPRPRLVLNSHELGSLPRRRRAAAAATPWQRAWLAGAAGSWERLQRHASHWADATLCVTPQDHELFARLGGRKLYTIPLGVDLEAIGADRDAAPPPRALFVGSFAHPPNTVAARLLVEEIWPRIGRALPGWELVLAGRGSDRFLADRPAPVPGIRAVGFVDDLAALFRTSRLFLAPLTEGGGIKIKILEAMARGIPVVTTPIGIEGIAESAPQTVWLADDVEVFCEQVLAAADQPEEADRRAALARRHIEAHFGWGAIARRLEVLYETI